MVLIGLVALFSAFAPTASASDFRRGDANGDGAINIADAITSLDFLFGPGIPPECEDAYDANDDGTINIADPIALLAALFGSPTVPMPYPYPGCGNDPTADVLTCVVSPCPPPAIYVAPTGSSGGAGTPQDPVATLEEGIALLSGSPGSAEIRLQVGSYSVSADVVVPDGARVLGGFDVAWAQTEQPDTILYLDGAGSPRILVQNATIVQFAYLRIVAPDTVLPDASANPVAVDSSNVTFWRCEIIAGNAGPGSAGAAGTQGFPGTLGGNAQSGCDGCSSNGFGGLGAALGGGNGGRGGYDTGGGIPGVPGNGGALGGSGGPSSVCFGLGFDGGWGASGADGSHGAGAGALLPGGEFSAATLDFHGLTGLAGAPGQDGFGGGGGGGGGGGQSDLFCFADRGGGGGGGGGGGSGALSGLGGQGGGSSICIIAFESEITLDDCVLQSGVAGNGGAGGTGAAGGEGAAGGAGGLGPDDAGSGGGGGHGGNGGSSGGSGGGGGGSSIGVLTIGSTVQSLNGTLIGFGPAGTGGSGGDAPVHPGADGPTGLAGQVVTP